MIEYVLDNIIIKNEINGICMFDLAKCFDTIDHKLLLFSLANMALMALNYYSLHIISMNELKLLPKMVKLLIQNFLTMVFHMDLYLVLCFLLYLLMIFPYVYQMPSVIFLLMILW